MKEQDANTAVALNHLADGKRKKGATPLQPQ